MKTMPSYAFILLLIISLVLGGFTGFLPSVTLAQTTLFQEDFEYGWNGWFADVGVWQVGEATVGPVGSGKVAGTILDGNYPFQAFSHLISPLIDLPQAGHFPITSIFLLILTALPLCGI